MWLLGNRGLLWFSLALAVNWAALIGQRLAFAWAFVPGFPTSFSSALAEQFALGLRFDLATLPVLVAPAVVWPWLSRQAALSRPGQFVLRLCVFGLFPLFVWGQLSVLAGTLYFAVNQKLPGWEYYAYLNDMPLLMESAFRDTPLVAGLGVFLSLLVLALGFRFSFPSRSPEPSPSEARPLTLAFAARAVSLQMLTVLLGLVALRGGWQQNPLRAADAMRTGNPVLDTLPLNTVFTALQDFSGRDEFRTFYPRDQNIAFIQKLLGRPEDFPNAEYPLLRRMPATLPVRSPRPNIVLVILESYTAALLWPYGGDPALAPEFRRIAESSVVFRRFFSAGGRSANGIFSMLAGIPDRAGRTILRSPQVSIRLGGVGRLLGAKGYETFFYHGGDLRFDNLDRVLPRLGFADRVGADELQKSGCCKHRHVWGYDDADTFAAFLRRLDRARRPFFGVVFTLNTHHPFAIPDHFAKPYAGRPQGDFLNAFHYTDHVLGSFFRQAQTRPWFGDTVFLITGDHAHHTGLDYLDDRMVPLLIYRPGRLRHQIREDVASQLDILPSVLSLAGGDSLYAGMGRDLFAPMAREPFAFFAGGSGTNVIGWIQGDRIYSEWLLGTLQGLYTSKKPLTLQELSAREGNLAGELRHRTRHFHQFARTIERENRVWPERLPP